MRPSWGRSSLIGKNRATEILGITVVMIPQQARYPAAWEGPGGAEWDSPNPFHLAVCDQETASWPHTWNTVMMAAGKVSKFAEGVPSLKLNLRRKFRENGMKIRTHQGFPSQDYAIFITSFPFLHVPLFATFPPLHVPSKDGIRDWLKDCALWRVCLWRAWVLRWSLGRSWGSGPCAVHFRELQRKGLWSKNPAQCEKVTCRDACSTTRTVVDMGHGQEQTRWEHGDWMSDPGAPRLRF